MKKMSAMAVGEKARVKSICLSGALELRLGELGLSSGSAVRCVGKSPLGDPAAYGFSSTVIALRHSDADNIYVE